MDTKIFIQNHKYLLNTNFNLDDVKNRLSSYDDYDHDKYCIVYLNVNRFNLYWKKTDTYIKSYTSLDINFAKAKYLSILNDINNDLIIVPPKLYVKNDNIKFKHGKSIFAILRDHSLNDIPCLILKDDISMFNNYKETI